MTHDNDLTGHEVTVIEQFKALLRKRPENVLAYFRIGENDTRDRALMAVVLTVVLEQTEQHKEAMNLGVAVNRFLTQPGLRLVLERIRDAHVRDYRHSEEGKCPTPENPAQRDPTCYLCGLLSEIDGALEGNGQ